MSVCVCVCVHARRANAVQSCASGAWRQADSEAGPQPRPRHHLFGRGPSAPVARLMMKCQLVIVPTKQPHLTGVMGGGCVERGDLRRGGETGEAGKLTQREMTLWAPPFSLWLSVAFQSSLLFVFSRLPPCSV